MASIKICLTISNLVFHKLHHLQLILLRFRYFVFLRRVKKPVLHTWVRTILFKVQKAEKGYALLASDPLKHNNKMTTIKHIARTKHSKRYGNGCNLRINTFHTSIHLASKVVFSCRCCYLLVRCRWFDGYTLAKFDLFSEF